MQRGALPSATLWASSVLSIKHNCLVRLPGLHLPSLLVEMGACFSCTPNPPTQYHSPESFAYWHELVTKASSTKDQHLKNGLPPYIHSTPASSPPLYFALNTQIPIVRELREQGPVITETHSRVVIMNNTGGGTLIQGIAINNLQGDVHFMPGGVWVWTSSADNTIIGMGRYINTVSRLRHRRCRILVLFIFSNELLDVTQLWYFPWGQHRPYHSENDGSITSFIVVTSQTTGTE
jgi:hypothetical protein